jgi:serine/threonine-protein kinase HipA
MRGLDFFENMLPEGPAHAQMATLAGVRPADTYGILKAFGRDCAGAIMVLPEGDMPGGSDVSGYTPMTSGDLQRLIGALDVAPLGVAPERGFRPSLAGFQRKALLGRAADGTWQLPFGDAPSTWILKPDSQHPMAANEATCLRLAAECGLDVPESELFDAAGLPVYAIRRYDRQDSSDRGLPARVHQEDGTACSRPSPRPKVTAGSWPSFETKPNALPEASGCGSAERPR